MIQTNITDRYTEIYVGGGNFITQSYPTNYHQYWKRKMLGPDEKIVDYMEVSVGKKSQLEATDAAYVRPPESFISAATALGVVFNDATGYFELNGLTDLTYNDTLQVLALYPFAARTTVYPIGTVRASFAYSKARTVIPFDIRRQGGDSDGSSMFSDCPNLEVVRLNPGYKLEPYSSGLWKAPNVFARCSKLHTVKGLVVANACKLDKAFDGCQRLETLELINLNTDLDLSACQSLSVDSIAGLVRERYEKGKYEHEALIDPREITIKLHSDAYARLTDDMIAAALDKKVTLTTT